MKWLLKQQLTINYDASALIGTLPLKLQIPQNTNNQQLLSWDHQLKIKIRGDKSQYGIYHLNLGKRGQEQIELKFLVESTDQPAYNLPITSWGSIPDSNTHKNQHLIQSTRYWNLNSEIIDVATQIRKTIEPTAANSELNLYDLIKAIFNHVKQTIQFRENQDTRFGAYKALKLRYGDCDEFTDLFIALCRAMRVPTRRITGYYLKTRTMIAEPHAWAEFKLAGKKWIPVDPALNFFGAISRNHIVFAYDTGFSNMKSVWSNKKIAGDFRIDQKPLEFEIKTVL